MRWPRRLLGLFILGPLIISMGCAKLYGGGPAWLSCCYIAAGVFYMVMCGLDLFMDFMDWIERRGKRGHSDEPR